MAKVTHRRAVEIAIAAVVFSVFVGLPIYAQTGTYPLAIVQGNSMYPTLHNGDLVIFGKAPQGMIANGTIVVFVQGETGVSALDSLVRPVVIHRIVGAVVQADGSIYYRTKGDNNQFVDPELIQANHVLGVPLQVVPSVGILVLFAGSPQGLVALIGMVTLFYLGRYEVKINAEEKKNSFLGDLTRLVLEGELSQDTLRLLEPVVKYGRDIQLDGSADDIVISLLGWMKKGGLDKGWKVEKMDCPLCSGRATKFVCPDGLEFILCQNCAAQRAAPSTPALANGESEPMKVVHRKNS